MDDDEREYGSSDNEQDEVMEDAEDVEADNEGEEDNEEEEEEQEEPEEAEPEAEAGPEADTGADDSQAAPGPDGQPTTTEAGEAGAQRSRHVSAAPSTPGAWRPKLRQEYLEAPLYDIVPTMAAPMSTSVNALAITPDLRYWMTGGSDGYIRKLDGVATINGKTPLTVAQRHPFVDSVTKAGVLVSYWENDEPLAPGARPEDKILSPVYSLAIHSGALWLLSGLESGGINLQSVRHDEGKKIHCLREGGHTNAVSVLQLAPDERSVLSGSWDKNVLDWDLNNGHVIRSFEGSGGQISALELRPENGAPIPAEASEPEIKSDTFDSNDQKTAPASFALFHDARPTDGSQAAGQLPGDDLGGGAPSPEHESLFGSPAGSLFGDTDNMGGGNAFGNDDDDGFMDMDGSTHHGLEHPGEFPMEDVDGPEQPMAGLGTTTEPTAENPNGVPPTNGTQDQSNNATDTAEPAQPEVPSSQEQQQPPPSTSESAAAAAPQEQQPMADPNNTATSPLNPQPPTSPSMLYKSAGSAQNRDPTVPTSSTTFFSAAIDGTIRLWDRRVPDPVARIGNRRGVPPLVHGRLLEPRRQLDLRGPPQRHRRGVQHPQGPERVAARADPEVPRGFRGGQLRAAHGQRPASRLRLARHFEIVRPARERRVQALQGAVYNHPGPSEGGRDFESVYRPNLADHGLCAWDEGLGWHLHGGDHRV